MSLGIILVFVAGCGELELAVTDSGQWGTTKGVEATAACTVSALRDGVTVRSLRAPRRALEISSTIKRSGQPMYIITVTRVDSGFTMVELRSQHPNWSNRARMAAQSCIG